MSCLNNLRNSITVCILFDDFQHTHTQTQTCRQKNCLQELFDGLKVILIYVLEWSDISNDVCSDNQWKKSLLGIGTKKYVLFFCRVCLLNTLFIVFSHQQKQKQSFRLLFFLEYFFFIAQQPDTNTDTIQSTSHSECVVFDNNIYQPSNMILLVPWNIT